MEDEGYMDTSDGRINLIANSPDDTAEFLSAYIACNVDPDSFTQSDLDKIQKKLNK